MLDFFLSLPFLTSVTGIWFFVWFVWPRLEEWIGNRGRSADERMADLKAAYYKEQNEIDVLPRSQALAAPRVEILRTGKKPDGLTCLLVNKGGTAMNLAIEPLGPFEADIEPTVTLSKGETGRISIQANPATHRSLQFELRYDDSYGQRVTRQFALSPGDGTFREV